jgi:hypothetical protein
MKPDEACFKRQSESPTLSTDWAAASTLNKDRHRQRIATWQNAKKLVKLPQCCSIIASENYAGNCMQQGHAMTMQQPRPVNSSFITPCISCCLTCHKF